MAPRGNPRARGGQARRRGDGVSEEGHRAVPHRTARVPGGDARRLCARGGCCPSRLCAVPPSCVPSLPLVHSLTAWPRCPRWPLAGRAHARSSFASEIPNSNCCCGRRVGWKGVGGSPRALVHMMDAGTRSCSDRRAFVAWPPMPCDQFRRNARDLRCPRCMRYGAMHSSQAAARSMCIASVRATPNAHCVAVHCRGCMRTSSRQSSPRTIGRP